MQIITISREFGSGGRELGKRLADILSYDYYDKEIIEKLPRIKEWIKTIPHLSWKTRHGEPYRCIFAVRFLE